MAFTLLGFSSTGESYPTFPPELATHIGWLVFAFTGLAVLWAWFRVESVRRSLLALEDPRTYAVLRIGFGLMTIACFLEMLPYWRLLWSDEGLFDLDYARERLGRSALRGWSPDAGFFDPWAVACFLWNKPSLFYLYGSPTFVVGYMLVFFAVLLLYTAGVGSRVTGVVSWLMLSGVYERNALYWEGTDTVYRCVWFLLLFARTGHAWSVDNWWRCRKLRKQGRLDEGSPPSGIRREPVYRLVPAWPRYLIMLQLAAIYVTTGAVKTGAVWTAGDALYYALNMDHFYRFEYATQWVSSVFGLNLFRVNTWVVHWWECLFPVVLVGVVLKFGLVHRHEPWYRAQEVAWRKWPGRAVLVAAYVVLYRIVVLSIPYCLEMKGDTPQDPGLWLWKANVVFLGVVPGLAVGWFVLGRWVLDVHRDGWRLGPLTRVRAWLRLPRLRVARADSVRAETVIVRIDQDLARGFTVGRRIWLTIGVIFHGFLIAFMNIGMFAPIMLMTYASYVRGEEFVQAFAWLAARLRRRRALAWMVPRSFDRALVPAQASAAVRPRGRPVPDAIVFAFGLIAVALVVGKVEKVEWIGDATSWWLGTIVVVSLAFRLLRPPAGPANGPALAYGAVGRALALGAVVWHASAVGLHLFPTYPIYSKWRAPARGIFASWLRGTGTTQSWRMFSPNPPRSNVFMQTVVVLENGDRWDLRNNAYHYDEPYGPPSRPNPWIINDRMRKMHRRMAGKGEWYLRYWAEYHCREWALEHGEMPKEIEINKLVTRIPNPGFVTFWMDPKWKGRRDPATGAISGQPYDPRKLVMKKSHLETHGCGKVTIPAHVKDRHGLPVTPEERAQAEKDERAHLRKFENRRETWEKRRDFGRGWAFQAEQAERRAEARRLTEEGLRTGRGRHGIAPGGPPGAAEKVRKPEPDEQQVGDDDGVE